MLKLGLVIAAAVVVLDQLTKAIMLDLIPDPGAGLMVTSFFNLVHVRNPGITFGTMQGVPPWLLSGLALVITAVLIVWLARADTRLLATALGLTIGGALGNIIDRVRFGAVFDFLDFHAFGWHWPAFNVADSAITVGVVGLLLTSMLGSQDGAKQEDNEQD